MFKGLYKFGENFMKVVALLFTALIFISAFIYTAYNYEMTGHWFDLVKDNAVYNLLGMAVILCLGVLLYLIIKKDFSKSLRVFLTVVIAWYFIACEYMAFFGRTMPNSDSWIVYAMAKQMAEGDLSIIHPTMSYMSYYPQQIGICAFLSLFIRAINLLTFSIEAFHFLVAIYGVFECITIFFLYKTVDNVFKSDSTNFVFLYLAIFNLPYIMYSSYLYGEVPALMFFSIGSAFLSALFRGKGRPVLNIVLTVLSMTLAVWVRKNTLILIIGVLIALTFETFKTKKYVYIVTALILGICAMNVLPVTVKYYERKADSTLTKGVTALSYVAMGMETPIEDINSGWYTGFNINTFEEAGCNVDIANDISKKVIKKRLDYFKSHPKEMNQFYKSKFLTQWVDGTYFSRESTYVYYGDRSNFLKNVYEGFYGKYYIYFCNIYQSIVFLGAFIWATLSLLKKTDFSLSQAFIFIGIFGGFLFHMMWEANSRYIITYAFLLIVYAAKGLSSFAQS